MGRGDSAGSSRGPPGRGEGRGEGMASSPSESGTAEGEGEALGSLALSVSSSERAVVYSLLSEPKFATTCCMAR